MVNANNFRPREGETDPEPDPRKKYLYPDEIEAIEFAEKQQWADDVDVTTLIDTIDRLIIDMDSRSIPPLKK